MTIRSGQSINRQRENGRYGSHRTSRRQLTRYIYVECPHCRFRPFTFTGQVEDSVCANLGKGCNQPVKAEEWIIVSDMTY